MTFKFVRIKKPKENVLDHIGKHLDEEGYFDDYVEIFQIEQSSLGEDVWKFDPAAERKLLEKINQNSSCLLKSLAGIHRCLYTGLNEAYVVDKETIEEYELERELLKPVLRGEDVRKWNTSWTGLYIIYPYKEANGQPVKVDLRKFPNVEKYLKQFKQRLMERWYIKKVRNDKAKEDKWFEYADPRNFEQFETLKLLTPDISTRNNFVMDTESYYCLNVIYAINLSTTKVDSKYLLGVLNSKLQEFYFKHISPFISGGYYRYITQYLERLPIKIPKTPEETAFSENLIENVEEIFQLSQKIRSIKERIQGFPESYFEDEGSLGKLKNVIKRKRLIKPSYIISEKKIRSHYFRELNGKEIFRILLATDEYLDFGSEEVASYVFDVLKTLDNITQRELLGLSIPPQDHLRTLMQQAKKDKEQILKNGKAVKELEKQIDGLVYKLYDITPKERRLIEEYLAKF